MNVAFDQASADFDVSGNIAILGSRRHNLAVQSVN
jgi:hypothetical protein